MGCLDYHCIESKCSERGCPPYPPREMVKILVYAYSTGTRSSRQIEDRLKYDIRFMWLSGGLKPDHNTIARFRKENYAELTQLFKDSVRVSAQKGLVMLNVVATDGTKIAARGSRRSIYDKEHIERELAAVEKILAEAEQIDAAEDAQDGSSGSPNSKKLAKAKQKKARLEDISERLEASDRQKIVATEPDARVMLTSGQKRPGYNMQATVDGQSQINGSDEYNPA